VKRGARVEAAGKRDADLLAGGQVLQDGCHGRVEKVGTAKPGTAYFRPFFGSDRIRHFRHRRAEADVQQVPERDRADHEAEVGDLGIAEVRLQLGEVGVARLALRDRGDGLGPVQRGALGGAVEVDWNVRSGAVT